LAPENHSASARTKIRDWFLRTALAALWLVLLWSIGVIYLDRNEPFRSAQSRMAQIAAADEHVILSLERLRHTDSVLKNLRSRMEWFADVTDTAPPPWLKSDSAARFAQQYAILALDRITVDSARLSAFLVANFTEHERALLRLLDAVLIAERQRWQELSHIAALRLQSELDSHAVQRAFRTENLFYAAMMAWYTGSELSSSATLRSAESARELSRALRSDLAQAKLVYRVAFAAYVAAVCILTFLYLRYVRSPVQASPAETIPSSADPTNASRDGV
jgi:hypothetical protein